MTTQAKPTNSPHSYPWLAHYPAHVRWDEAFPVRPLTSLLEESARRFPAQPAIIFEEQSIAYAQLWERVRRLASALRRRGVGKGSHVGLMLNNCPEFIIGYYAALLTGATLVNYNPLYAARDIAHQIEDSHTEVMITLAAEGFYPKLAGQLGNGPLKTVILAEPAMGKELDLPQDDRHLSFASLLEEEPLAEFPAPALSDVALLQYTGGTTGIPKAAMLSHGNIAANALQTAAWYRPIADGEARLLGILPLCHVFAMTVVMNLALIKSWTIILHPAFDTAKVLRDIAQHRITVMPAVPTMLNALLHHESAAKADFSGLKICISGGAPLPLEMAQRFAALVPSCRVVEGYGLSETSPVVAMNPPDGRSKIGSIGVPFPGTVITVRNEQGEAMPLGEVGELCVTGPQVMQGYWNKPEETARVQGSGYLRTGDMAKMDEEGYLFIVDRVKDMIITGGFKVYPRQVEEVLYTHPEIIEAAVIGVPDAHRGEVVKAFVAKKKGSALDEAGVKAFLKDKVAAFARPSFVEFLETLPKTAVGKISRKDLRG